MLTGVLRGHGNRNAVRFDHRGHRSQVDEWRRDHEVRVLNGLIAKEYTNLLHQVDGLDVVEIHLPVADDQWLLHLERAFTKGLDAGQVAEFHELQRRSATGGHKAHLIFEAEHLNGGNRVTATNN